MDCFSFTISFHLCTLSGFNSLVSEMFKNHEVHAKNKALEPQISIYSIYSIYRHSKSRFFCAVKTVVLKFCAGKSAKTSLKIT